MDTHINKRTNRHARTHACMDMYTKWTGTLTHTHSHIHTQARGPGQNRVNPSTAGGGNPMQVTYSKDSKASRGGFMMTKQGWWMLAGTMSWTWVGLHSGEDIMSGTCRQGGGVDGGRVVASKGWVDALKSAGCIYIRFFRKNAVSCLIR